VKGFIDSLVRKGFRRGLLGGENIWLVLGAAALVARFTTRALAKKEEVVFSEELGIGERIVITHSPPKGHNGRREGPAPQPQAGG
jgi:hypothetical protein